MIEASFWHRDRDSAVCDLCPRHCRMADGCTGYCGARTCIRGTLYASSYGNVSALRIDPIEKKPFFHYRPGTDCLSIGGLGCNMRCLHCQNHAISAVPSFAATERFEPDDLTRICDAEGTDTLAFTYNEPTIWMEYVRDTAHAARGKGVVTVTNGLISEEALKEATGFIDAMSIDVKGFTDRFYRDVCDARLDDVLRTCEITYSSGVHVELDYLVIPGLNDSPEEVEGFCGWVRDSLSERVAVHFTAFHPDRMMMDRPPAAAHDVLKAREIGLSCGLRYVYCGNARIDGAEDTICPSCGAVAIRRSGFETDTAGLDGGRCRRCGSDLDISGLPDRAG